MAINAFLGVIWDIEIHRREIFKEYQKQIKQWLMILIIKVLNFLSKKYYSKIELKNNICIIFFCYENNLVYFARISKQIFEDHMDLLLVNDENKSHYICIKNLERFTFNKTKDKSKKHFYKYCLQFLVVKTSRNNIERYAQE